jgi:hypothetical protein
MPHSMRYNAETGIVEITHQGMMKFAEIKEIYTKALHLAKKNATPLFLSDFREARLGLSTSEIYQLPEIFSEMTASAGREMKNIKRAIIISEDADDFHFFETVSANRGQNAVKIFHDGDDATRWLLEN